MAKHIYSSAYDWMLSKINRLEAANDATELANCFRSLLSSGDIDNDTIQDVFQSDMDEDGFFFDFESSPVDEADPSQWSIADCQWFLDNRLGIDLNTIDRADLQSDSEEPETDIEAWQNYVAARIDEYDETPA